MNYPKNIRIGDLLREYGYVDDEQIEAGLAYQKEQGVRLGDALIALGFITEMQKLEALGQRFGISIVDLSDLPVDVNAVKVIPHRVAERSCVLAVRIDRGSLYVVTNDPTDFYGLEDVRQMTGMNLELALSEKAPLEQAINRYYAEVDTQKAAAAASVEFVDLVERIDIDDGDDTPIINLVESLLNRAYDTGASDIHIEPFEHETVIRMRVDGVITPFIDVQKNIHPPLVARIKIISDLDIAERRVPQDGHFRFRVTAGELVNVRVSVIPTVFGEKVVMRLLASTTAIDHDTQFGMDDDAYARFSQILKSPNGIIYLTGPTGSGKSTTLYMVLERLAQQNVNISTIEDPVEKNVAKVSQMQVNNLSGLTFSTGLRALLRQDPDIIMIGETRDNETASISIRAAITGHIVLSTLHTNDAASSIARLEDMGTERYMVANSVTGIVAQRLVRKLCTHCAEDSDLKPEEREFLGVDSLPVKRAKGCRFCDDTGYRGRVAIHEVLVIDKRIRRMIMDGASSDEIKDYAVRKQGMKTLKDSGFELVKAGVTTVDELVKVAYYV